MITRLSTHRLQTTALGLAMSVGVLSATWSCKCSPEIDPERRHSTVILDPGSGLAKAVKKTIPRFRRRVRVAVLDFRDRDGGSRYMATVTDEVIRQLGAFPELQLLERSRLRELLREKALAKSGILDEQDRARIGRLLAADVIVSGFYQLRGTTRIRVRGRFTELSTGEIIDTFSFGLRLAQETRRRPVPGNILARCRRVAEPLMAAMEDLRTEAQVAALVDRAVLVPFDRDCGQIHLTIIRKLVGYKLFPEKYRSFLAATLMSLSDPDAEYDRRPLEILRYFAADGRVDETEWQSGVVLLQNARSWIPRLKGRVVGGWLYYRFLFAGGREGQSVRRGRIDQVMGLAAAGKLGRPRVITESVALARIMRGLGSQRGALEPIAFAERLYAFRTYGRVLGQDQRSVSRVLGNLTGAYLHHTAAPGDRRALRDSLVEFLAAQPKSPWLARIIWKWMDRVESHIQGRLVMAKPGREELSADLERINEGLRSWICTSISREKSARVRAVQMAYARRNGVACRGVRSAAELAALLADKKTEWPVREKVLLLLLQMGSRALPAEGAAQYFLGPIGHAPKARKSRQLAARVLGNLKPPTARSLQLLVEALGERDPAHGEAVGALSKQGPAAVAALAVGLGRSRDSGVRFECARLLGKLGRDARPALSTLRNSAQRDSARHVRRAADQARQLIENDF